MPMEGGIRTAAFVSGGYLPPAVRGTVLDAPVHIADWCVVGVGAGGGGGGGGGTLRRRFPTLLSRVPALSPCLPALLLSRVASGMPPSWAWRAWTR
jgi:hypothetical protein